MCQRLTFSLCFDLCVEGLESDDGAPGPVAGDDGHTDNEGGQHVVVVAGDHVDTVIHGVGGYGTDRVGVVEGGHVDRNLVVVEHVVTVVLIQYISVPIFELHFQPYSVCLSGF